MDKGPRTFKKRTTQKMEATDAGEGGLETTCAEASHAEATKNCTKKV